ncbi:M15 family metallopeptidase [Streptosporangium sp. NBC_01755]|uniref:M15 family metallopeptidase n=1 Tax=unclassified Streptosporangium TaxID=2632669 RepID=UPI002DD9A92D|nr:MULTISPECIES: M15 family metallopeptidase [unclassified Streptosporangium]WSA25111.1 M15 family metallopeptidase [Streptosporangium sp. NBC_01810]WSD03548.1 M15 family metallopeptidase [Streptosporangium sp. NBC_01755]
MARSRFTIRTRAALAVTVGCLAAASCGTATSQPTSAQPTSAARPTSAASGPTGPQAAAATPTTAPEPTTATPTPTGPPKFSAKISPVTRQQLKYSWRPGCPVPLSDLRLITMTYWGFDDKPHTGELVVYKGVTDDIVSIFRQLYDWRWPINKMELVDVYKGDDFDSIEANNTSAFNCRPATGSSSWSKHAYGRAIDINPRENPYVSADGSVAHSNARKFAKRPVHAPGVINPGDRVVKAFQAKGWEWGGYWSGIKDYQHFSKGGG